MKRLPNYEPHGSAAFMLRHERAPSSHLFLQSEASTLNGCRVALTRGVDPWAWLEC